MRNAVLSVVALAFLGVLLWAVVQAPAPQVNLPNLVAEAMPESGVDHPITAVLLNFRSYDTLLEIGVLLLAVSGGLALARDQDVPAQLERAAVSPLLKALAQWLVPLMLVVAGYLLWAGKHRPGGAFQAGAVVAAAGVLLRFADIHLRWPPRDPFRWGGFVMGFAVFLGVAVSVMAGGRPFLTYPNALAGGLILVIEAFLTLSIGFILLGLFDAAPASPHWRRTPPVKTEAGP
jgi:multisubunit Na+/H+ antiporter MnhB subunit